MQISSLLSDVNFLCGSTSGTYPNADKVRNMNIAYQDVARLIWDSSDGWQYDDGNATTLPIAYTTMVHSQQDYSLPSTCQAVERVEVKDSNGNWVKLRQMDIHDISVAMPEYQNSPNLPIYYDLMGSSVLLYPAPASGSTTLASGMAVYMSRDINEIAVTATTTTPGFATPFHRILSYAAALDFVQDNVQRQFLAAQKTRLEQGLVRFYSKRNVERPTTIRPAGRRTWRKYV